MSPDMSFEHSNSIDFFDDENDDQEIDEGINVKEISEIVVYGTDWTTATILDQLVRENILLNPRFQRRDAWDVKRKSRFIESLILGLPVPQIVLATHKKERGKYLVLDGKQRLLTILQFYGKSDTKNNNFALKGLELKKDLNTLRYQDICENILYNEELSLLDNQTIRTNLIRNWSSENLLYKIFLRLNVESTPLSPQELRQALHPGLFSSFIDDKSLEIAALKKIFSTIPDYRMRDVELLIRYLSFQYFLKEYRGNLKSFLDSTCDKLNKDWENFKQNVEESLNNFEEAVNFLIEIFGITNFSRIWLSREGKYQNRLNRAIFDVMIFYFSDIRVRDIAKNKKPEIEKAFQDLCSLRPEFVSSVERTSKNIQETFIRFSLWGGYLSTALDTNFNVPSLDAENNRIIFNGLW
jgi:Protein of unknown function DUF262